MTERRPPPVSAVAVAPRCRHGYIEERSERNLQGISNRRPADQAVRHGTGRPQRSDPDGGWWCSSCYHVVQERHPSTSPATPATSSRMRREAPSRRAAPVRYGGASLRRRGRRRCGAPPA